MKRQAIVKFAFGQADEVRRRNRRKVFVEFKLDRSFAGFNRCGSVC
jgi:hypothetical protein